MKKAYVKFLSTAVIAAMMMPMVSAYADTNDHKANPDKPKVQTGQTQKETVQARNQKTRELLKKEKEEMHQNIQEIHTLKMQVIEQKHIIDALIENLLNNKNSVSKGNLNQINKISDTIKADIEAINSGKGKMTAENQNIEKGVKAKDVEGVAKGIENVLAIQQARIDGLTKLYNDLTDMIKTLETVKNDSNKVTPTPANPDKDADSQTPAKPDDQSKNQTEKSK